jgi:cysteine desulfurase
MKKPIYLDYNSTTPLDPRCLEVMMPYLTDDYGNAANEIHSMGWTARHAITKATTQVAELLNCKPHEVLWNSGATEGNNSVLQFISQQTESVAGALRPHFITSSIEHPSVLQTCISLQNLGRIDLSILPVDSRGFVSLSDLEKAITAQTKLCSIMWVNNEIGTVQDMKAIAELCQKKNVLLHTDATQAVGKIAIDFKSIPIHFLTASAHKFYGPKGIGFLITRSENPYTPSPKLMYGGSHQNGFRPGTMNTAAIAGAGKACEISLREMVSENRKYSELILNFVEQLKMREPKLIINGPPLGSDTRSAMNLNITFPHKQIDLYISKLTGVAFSQGAACQSGEASMSQTLRSIGLSEAQAQCTLRMSVGRLTTEADIKQAVEIISRALAS